MKKILFATQTSFVHPALGRVFSVRFTDKTEHKMYAETFYHQIKGWNDNQPLEGHVINLNEAFLFEL